MVILFVDPSEESRARRVGLLEAAGQTVFSVADAPTAVKIAQEVASLDVLVTESILGDYTGFDLRDALREKFPGLRAVFTSRYDLTGYDSAVGTSPVLFEPVSESHLLSEILGYTSVEASPSAPPPTGALTGMALSGHVESTPPSLAQGEILGSYIIKERLYEENDTETYRAMQQGVSREVGLVLLKKERQQDKAVLERFQERQRIKAAITHSHVAPLYEAVRTDKHTFYTRELPHGRNLSEISESGDRFDEKTLVDIITAISDAMSYATLRGYHYRMPSMRDIFVDSEHNASVVNVFRPAAATPRDFIKDTQRFLVMLRNVAEGPRSRHLLDDLFRENLDWQGLHRRAADLQEQMRQRSLLRRADTKEQQDIQIAQGSNNSARWVYIIMAVIAIALTVGIFIRGTDKPKPPPPVTETMVHLPGGSFTLHNAPGVTLPEFWMDKYEVSIGQYADFLEFLKTNPTQATAFDHPEQPTAKTDHTPKLWDQVYAAARMNGKFRNQTLHLSCPVVDVDWWDAYAYAKWKGRRLPTEQEWERAARGSQHNQFPWGNTADPKKANLGTDYNPEGVGGNVDGHNFWAAVNEMSEDVTPEGIMGLGGNVEEWTSTWKNHPDYPDLQVPVVRGGHFALRTMAGLLTSRNFPLSADDAGLARGFRTVSDKAPTSPHPPR